MSGSAAPTGSANERSYQQRNRIACNKAREQAGRLRTRGEAYQNSSALFRLAAKAEVRVVVCILAAMLIAKFFGEFAFIALFVISIILIKISNICFYKCRRNPLNTNEITTLFRWTTYTEQTKELLTSTSLGLYIIDNSLWDKFVDTFPSTFRQTLLGKPNNFGFRLLQAVVLWEPLLEYVSKDPASRQNATTRTALAAAGSFLARVGELEIAASSTLNLKNVIHLARLSELHRFFYPDDEAPELAPAQD